MFAVQTILHPIDFSIHCEATRILASVLACDRDARRLAVGGKPAEQIVRLDQEVPGEGIIVGTHGRMGRERLLLGSVARQVLRTALYPVLPVRSILASEPPIPVRQPDRTE